MDDKPNIYEADGHPVTLIMEAMRSTGKHPATVGQLAKRCGITAPTVTKYMKILVETGQVEVTTNLVQWESGFGEGPYANWARRWYRLRTKT